MAWLCDATSIRGQKVSYVAVDCTVYRITPTGHLPTATDVPTFLQFHYICSPLLFRSQGPTVWAINGVICPAEHVSSQLFRILASKANAKANLQCRIVQAGELLGYSNWPQCEPVLVRSACIDSSTRKMASMAANHAISGHNPARLVFFCGSFHMTRQSTSQASLDPRMRRFTRAIVPKEFQNRLLPELGLIYS